MIMFWARYYILWWVIAGELVIAGLLIRTGVSYFNREELLGRELDTINLKSAFWRVRMSFFGKAPSVKNWYLKVLPATLLELRLPILFSSIALLIGYIAGFSLADEFRLPAHLVAYQNLGSGFIQGLESMRFFSTAGIGIIWLHNLRVALLATALGIFSFGVLGVLILMLPLAMFGFFAQAASAISISPLTFLAAFAFPHGFLEFPAIILTGAVILRVGATMVTPAPGQSISEAWLRALADWARIVVVLIIPLFLCAALIESFITPHTMLYLLGNP